MNSEWPYLVGAYIRWIEDNHCIPHLLVQADMPGTRVPVEYVQDGEIVLSLGTKAIRDLVVTLERITFKAAFPGVVYEIIIPIMAVKAVYAKENGEGLYFEDFVLLRRSDESPGKPEDSGKTIKKAPHLRVIE